ncbi:MAG: hypothetical protein IKH19_03360 [Muribaculaceae bacterium]|nr:hypothetical protein [Muribaculaceae bacterium]
MKMKSIVILMSVVAMLVACAPKSQGGEAAVQSTSQKADAVSFQFLKQLGMDPSKVKVLQKGETFNGGNDAEALGLTDAQRRALLNDVYHFDLQKEDEMETNFFVTAVAPLAGNHTLVVFLEEFGDGSSQALAVYDAQGHLTDYVDAGTWASVDLVNANEEYTEGTGYELTGDITMDGPNGFVVNRQMAFVDWKSNEETYMQPVKKHWAIKHRLNFACDNQGHLKLTLKGPEVEGKPEANEQFYQDLRMVSQYPMSDASRLDLLNKRCSEPNVVRDMAESGLADNIMKMALWSYYHSNPQQLLSWMAAHRGGDNKLRALFEELFAAGWADKYQLVKFMEQMPDAAARKYMEDLTAQWGPRDAVG